MHPQPSHSPIAVGPVVGDQYQYAIVTDPLQLSLYVLARDPDYFAAKFDAQVRAQLNAWGFNQTINKPVPMIQTGCVPPM